MDYSYYHYWGMHIFWWIFWIALVAIIFIPKRTRRSSKSILLHILRKTYAEGKISTQEFEERKKVLEKEFGRQKEIETTVTDPNKNS